MTKYLLAAGNTVTSILIPVILGFLAPKTFTDAESILFGALIFIGLTSIELLFLAGDAYAKEHRILAIWDAREALDMRLQEVRRLFHLVEEQRVGQSDLFVPYFNKKLANLETALRDAATKKEIRIDETMLEVTTWLMQASFQGRKGDIFRAVHFTSDNAFFLGLHSRRYFAQALDLVASGRLRQVKRLVVFDTPETLSEPLTRRIIHFHMEHPAYELRVLSRKDFTQILLDYRLNALIRDFGIYGESYVYKGLSNVSEDDISGFYSRDTEEIRRFTDCFETCWEAAATPTHTGPPGGQVSIDTLFAPPLPSSVAVSQP